jgi:hypothetical protein
MIVSATLATATRVARLGNVVAFVTEYTLSCSDDIATHISSLFGEAHCFVCLGTLELSIPLV